MRFLDKIQNASNWNIGFCSLTPEQLISRRKLGQITWMEHPYRDRFFADPFILRVTDDTITVLAEEYVFDNPPGTIVELVVDRSSMKLVERHPLLTLPTHLSYPAIFRDKDTIWVYPENGASGELNLYRYDPENHKLHDAHKILDVAVADATILKKEGSKYLLIATKYPETQQKAFAYVSDNILSGFSDAQEAPVQISKKCSRPGGNFFTANGRLFRPAQDCSEVYGGALSIMEFDPETLAETFCFKISPKSYRYSLGLHTINFEDNICVVDGYGYYLPTLGRIYASGAVAMMRQLLKKILRHGK